MADSAADSDDGVLKRSALGESAFLGESALLADSTENLARHSEIHATSPMMMTPDRTISASVAIRPP